MSIPSRHSPAYTQPAIDHASRSLSVLKRAAFKLWLFVLASSAQALVGHGFVAPLATLALMSSILDIALGHWHREQVTAPHYTYFDEAVWFLMLAYILRLTV